MPSQLGQVVEQEDLLSDRQLQELRPDLPLAQGQPHSCFAKS